MPLFDPVLVLVFTLIDLIKGAIIFAVPLFLLTLLGLKLKEKILKRYQLSWFQSSFLVIYILTLLLILVLYFGIYAIALQDYDIGIFPAELQESFLDAFTYGLLFMAVVLLKKLLAALAVTLIALPFAFLASFFNTWIEKKLKKGKKGKGKKPNQYLVLALGVLATAFIALIVLYWLTFIVPGVLYLVLFF